MSLVEEGGSEAAVRAATRVRSRLALPCNRPTPVVQRVLPSLGARVFWANLATEDGFTHRDPSTGAVGVWLNLRLRSEPARLRFTAAHEAGHIAMGHLTTAETDVSPEAAQGREREANVFATELLMPAEAFRGVTAPVDRRVMGDLERRLGVSWDALMNRLDQLGVQEKDESLAVLRGRMGAGSGPQ